MALHHGRTRREALRDLGIVSSALVLGMGCEDGQLPRVQPPVPVWRLDEPATPVPENLTYPIADGVDYRTPENNFLYTHVMNDLNLFPGSVGALSDETIGSTRSAAMNWGEFFADYRNGASSTGASTSAGNPERDTLRSALAAAYVPLILEMTPALSDGSSPVAPELRALSHLDTLLLNGIVVNEQAMMYAGYLRRQASGELPGRFFYAAYLTLPLLVNGSPQHYFVVDGFPILNSRSVPVSSLQSLDGVVRVMESTHPFPPEEVTE